MNNSEKMSKRLEVLFLKTKILCFGRYALEVPREAELILGDASLPSTIETTKGKLVENDDRILKAIRKIETNDSSAEIVYNGKGPLENSWQIQYFDSKFAKEDGALYFKTYVTKGDLTFILMGSIPKGGTIASAAAKQLMRAKSLRLRDSDKVPAEPGYCIEAGFMSEDDYDNQEMVDAGLYLPSFPDVAFSVTANKDAYSDYPPEEFEKKVRVELSLLARTQQAKDQQGKTTRSVPCCVKASATCSTGMAKSH
ncbi:MULTISPECIES: T6SS immunity protein Tli4 family protein [unclassified Janthinobacterium]|uniref:T6SS immunity protein Tli4 family protein n=1 Tax=unclassified Janthinobacterium TaxID=2610881 RepID=UPI001607A3F6|nr:MULTISPECIES: T6SS immunity protein Tli4 family protein [unclassified Janthinobacterium]MBB5609899.1 hypothetical protein [Janthinobacterium sp. S3T4]MBB5615165.1 hypothetical protein [Janthinobacterium sp. S3M3]